MKQNILVSHTDLDGYGCNVVGKIIDPNITCINVNYDILDETILDLIKDKKFDDPETTLFITDLCPSDEVLDAIDKLRCDKHLYDHHKSNIGRTAKYSWAVVEPMIYHDKNIIQVSGTYLFLTAKILNKFDGVYFDSLKMFCELVRAWDTWSWKEPDYENAEYAENLNRLFTGYKDKNDFVDHMVMDYALPNESFYNMYAEDMTRINTVKEQEEFALDYATKTLAITTVYASDLNLDSDRKYNVGLCFSVSNLSKTSDTILTSRPDIDFMIIISPHTKTLSFRTQKDDIDVSSIAKIYGGGGHPKASGAPLRESVLGVILDAIIFGARLV